MLSPTDSLPTLFVQAGAGIVADSDPHAEWQETLSKCRAVFRAAVVRRLGRINRHRLTIDDRDESFRFGSNDGTNTVERVVASGSDAR